jgi:hypothetical protein
MNAKWLFSVAVSCAAPAAAAPSASANYQIQADSMDCGGQPATSTSYTNQGSAGQISGITTSSPPLETAKTGYLGQLYETLSLQITADPATVNEGGNRQLAAAALLDDATLLEVNPASITWSILFGPVTSISTSGLAIAGTVYQNSQSRVAGNWFSLAGSLDLTVIDTDLDNFGTYAGDGLTDSWQYLYFGPDNPQAGPTNDPDGDQQDNRFEFIAGIVPTDSASRFALRIESVPGFPGRRNLTFGPRLADRIYTVTAKDSLIHGAFTPLESTQISDSGQERTVTDLNANGSTKFYRVEVTKP